MTIVSKPEGEAQRLAARVPGKKKVWRKGLVPKLAELFNDRRKSHN